MTQRYSIRKELLADCPNCRQPSLILLKAISGKQSEDLLACKSCKLVLFSEDLKKKLFTI